MPKRAKKLFLYDQTPRLDALMHMARTHNIACERLSKPAFFERFGDEVVHQGAMLITDSYPYVDLAAALEQKPGIAVVLDEIEDPRNLGRAARSAACFGAKLLIIQDVRGAKVTATAEKTAVGALAQIQVALVSNLNQAIQKLKEAGFWVAGTAQEAAVPAWQCDLTGDLAIVIGKEETGLRRLVRENCDALVSIPMQSPDQSLNAADALTVLLYEVTRQRVSQRRA